VDPAVRERARAVRLAVFDVDGVLTDGTLYLTDGGEEIKAFNTLDGHGLKMLMGAGVETAIITARTSRVVERRARDLGIARLHQGAHDKRAVFESLCRELGINTAAASYMGDDVVDLPVLRHCGLAITVPAAPEIVKRHAHVVTAAGGGRGAVREACELILAAQDRLDAQLAPYLA